MCVCVCQSEELLQPPSDTNSTTSTNLWINELVLLGERAGEQEGDGERDTRDGEDSVESQHRVTSQWHHTHLGNTLNKNVWSDRLEIRWVRLWGADSLNYIIFYYILYLLYFVTLMLMDANIKIYTCQVLGYFCLQSCAGHMTYSNKTKKNELRQDWKHSWFKLISDWWKCNDNTLGGLVPGLLVGSMKLTQPPPHVSSSS